MRHFLLILLFPVLLFPQTTMKVQSLYTRDLYSQTGDSIRVKNPLSFLYRTLQYGPYTYNLPYGSGTFALTTGSGSVGNADSLIGYPGSAFLRWTDTTSSIASKTWSNNWFLKKSDSTLIRTYSDALYWKKSVLDTANRWAPKGTYLFPSDTTLFRTFSDSFYVTKSTTQVLTGTKYWTNQQFFRDSVFISGKLIHGSSNYMASPYNGMISGEYDSIYSTASSAGGQNYVWGRNNTIGRTNPTGTYGNWMWGQYLRSEGAGNWFLGADDDFQKKIVPLQATIGFINEKVIHWGSNSMNSLYDYMLSYATQTPHVKDSIRFGWRLTKYGSAIDTLANAGFALEGQRGWTVNSYGVMSNEGTRIKRYFSINDNDDDAFHFNSYNTSGKPFGNVYVDSAHLIVSRGYLDADSLRFDGTTVGTKLAWRSGLGASYWGNITTGTITANGAIGAGSNAISGGAISGTTGTFTGDITDNKSSGDLSWIMNAPALANDNYLVFRKGGLNQWALWNRQNQFRIWNYYTGTSAVAIDSLTNAITIAGAATFSGGLVSNTFFDAQFQVRSRKANLGSAYLDFRDSAGINSIGYVGMPSTANKSISLYAGSGSDLTLYGQGSLGLTISTTGAATFASNLTAGGWLASRKTSGAGYIYVEGDSATAKDIEWVTRASNGDSSRWTMRVTTTETKATADVGSDWQLIRRSNSGSALGTVLQITRSNGNWTYESGKTHNFGTSTISSGAVTSTGMSTLDTLTTSHIKGKSSAPTIAAGTGAGTSPSVSIVTNSTDLAGEILVRTGTTPTANGDIVTVTFNKNYTRPPQVVLTPSTGLAAAHAALVYIKSTSGTTFVVTDTVTALTASQVYRWKYHVIE